MITTQYINLNMIPSGVLPILYCSQYDVGRPLGIIVYNGSGPVDLDSYAVTIEATRTDKTPITAAVTTDGNIGAFVTTATMTNKADKYPAKLVLSDSQSHRVASLAFIMCVTPKTMDENAESIEEDASLYQQYTETVQSFIASLRVDLNTEAAARRAADNTLQSNINAEASIRATQDASLQSQINQLIAPSGSAPSAAEVENARVGADGTVYSTLGDAIRTQDTQLKNALNENGIYAFTVKGGSGESWSTVEFFPEQKEYDCIIKAFTVRSALTSGYTASQVYTYANASDTTGTRVFYKSVGGFVYQDEYIHIDNKGGNIYKIVVSVRPETDTFASVYFKIDEKTDTLISDVKALDKEGLGRFTAFDFTYGDFDSSTGAPLHNNRQYRICTINLLSYKWNLKIVIASGWRVYVALYRDDGTVQSNQGWKTGTYDLKANQKFACTIARVTEDTSEVLDIHTALENVTFDSAIDSAVLRLSGVETDVTNIKQIVSSQSATYDFSDKTIGATYVGIRMPIKLLSGATYKFIITAPETDENIEYFLFYDADGKRLISTGILNGSGSRTVSFENTYGKDAVLVEMVLVKVNAQSVYAVEFVNSDNINEDIDALDARVSALESGISPESEIPEYFETNLASAIAEAQTAMLSASINGETFVFLSDIHWENNEKHSPALIKAVTDALPIENTFYGGDTFNGGTQEKVIGIMNDVRQKFTAASPHFLSVYGNHDGNQLDGGTAFTHNEFYTLMQKQADYYVEYEAPCYYYMDNEATKTRFIVLDSRTGTPSTASAQISWLQSITSAAPAGWHFLVFVHVIYYPGEGGAYDDPTTWIMSPFMTDVCTALDAVNTAGGKKVEAIFGGHCHIDYNGQTSGGIPIVMIDCDTRQTVSGNPQSAGTIGEQCLDIVTVNYSAEEIHCARIGRGASRTITY